MTKTNVELLKEANEYLSSIKKEDILAMNEEELAEFKASFDEFQARMTELKAKIDSK